jgi:hypothetical protein
VVGGLVEQQARGAAVAEHRKLGRRALVRRERRGRLEAPGERAEEGRLPAAVRTAQQDRSPWDSARSTGPSANAPRRSTAPSSATTNPLRRSGRPCVRLATLWTDRQA